MSEGSARYFEILRSMNPSPRLLAAIEAAESPVPSTSEGE